MKKKAALLCLHNPPAYGSLPFPHLTAACALSVLSTAEEMGGGKLMLPSDVQAWLFPENPISGG